MLIASIATAQTPDWNVAISFGVSVPMGDFKSTSLTSNSAGMATNGFFVKMDGDYKPQNTIGLTTALLFNTNPVDEGQTGLKLENRINDNYRTLTEAESDELQFNSNYWLWGSALVGPRLSFPVKKMRLSLKAMTGIHVSFLPVHEMIFDDADNDILFHTRVKESSKASLPLLAGIDFDYPVRENISFKFSASYYYAQVKYSLQDLTFNTQTQVIEQGTHEEFKIPLHALQLGVGFVYHLGG